MPTIAELTEKLAAKRRQLAEAFASYPNMSADEVEAAQRLNAEVEDLARDHAKAAEIDRMLKANAAAMVDLDRPAPGARLPSAAKAQPAEEPRRSFGEQLIASEAFKARGRKGFAPVTLSRKALLDTTDYAIHDLRLPRIEPYALRMEHVADLMPQGQTDANSLTYLEETTATNGATTVAEGGTKPESELAFTERTIAIRKIATLLPVTDELLADAPALRSYVESRLRQFVMLTEDTQLVSGNGTAPNIRGLLNTSGIQTQAKGADPTPDAIFKAMTKIMVNAFLSPDGIIMHPNDWQDIRLLRTADGIYIWGNPSEAGPARIWCLNVVATTAMTENTALVGAFQYATQVFRRDDITVDAAEQHASFFAENKVMLRAEERLGLAVYRPAALCTVTGI